MVTYCSSCGRNITKNEKNEDNFVVCKYCNKYSAKNNKLKGGIMKMEKKQENITTEEEKIKNKAQIIRELLSQNKSVDEIVKETNIRRAYVNSVIKHDNKK